jgi:hypothetical protein
MYIALPGFEPGSRVGHNLASVGRRVPELPGLGSLTQVFALAVFRAQGACQWDSPALRVHARLRRPVPEQWLCTDDHAAMQRLQERDATSRLEERA